MIELPDNLRDMTKPLAVVQARMSSERLPGKVLLDLGGRPILDWVIAAARGSDAVQGVVVATSNQPEDDAIAARCNHLGVATWRGSLNDVLSRYLDVAEARGASALVRLTGDCPLLDPSIIAQVTSAFAACQSQVSYVSNTVVRTLPRGLDCEVVSTSALQRAAELADDLDREHVTRGILRRPAEFSIFGIAYPVDASRFRVTLDTEDDLRALRMIVADLGSSASDHRQLVRYLRSRPDVVAINAGVAQKEA